MLTKQPKKTQRRAYSPLRTRGTGYKYVQGPRPRPRPYFINQQKLTELYQKLVSRQAREFREGFAAEAAKAINHSLQDDVDGVVLLADRFGDVVKAWNQLVTRAGQEGFTEEDVLALGFQELVPGLLLLDRVLATLGPVPTDTVIDYLNWWFPVCQQSMRNLLDELPGFLKTVAQMLFDGKEEEDVRSYVRNRLNRIVTRTSIAIEPDTVFHVVSQFSKERNEHPSTSPMDT